MNKHFKNLRRVEFVVTDACSAACKHCSQGEHNSSTNINKDIASEALKKITQLGKISSVMTFGGEALLFPDTVYEIHKTAKEAAILHRQLITNGYFSRDSAFIREVAHKLILSGVNDILISADAFHQETIPVDVVLQFAEAVNCGEIRVRLNPAWLINKSSDNFYNNRTKEILKKFERLGIEEGEGNVVFPEGNALKNLSEYFDPDKLIKNPYEENPEDVRTISFSANGDVLNGNIYKKDIIDIINDYSPCK